MENKTAEETLEKHCPSMSNLYLDDNGIKFRARVVKSMEEYASIKLAEKDKEIESYMSLLDDASKTVVEKDKEIERLSKWNLSEEKPKSEVPVLAIIKGNKVPVRVMWVEKFSLSSDEWEFNGEEDYNEENDTYYWPEGWYEWNEMEEVHWMCKDVLFWMDMPQIPESLNK